MYNLRLWCLLRGSRFKYLLGMDKLLGLRKLIRKYWNIPEIIKDIKRLYSINLYQVGNVSHICLQYIPKVITNLQKISHLIKYSI